MTTPLVLHIFIICINPSFLFCYSFTFNLFQVLIEVWNNNFNSPFVELLSFPHFSVLLGSDELKSFLKNIKKIVMSTIYYKFIKKIYNFFGNTFLHVLCSSVPKAAWFFQNCKIVISFFFYWSIFRYIL